MPADPSARFIYLVRSGRDACVSFYHHLSHQAEADGGFDGSFDEFVEKWCAGEIAYGSWPAHLKSWVSGSPGTLLAGRDERVLVLSYEALKADLRGSCARIARHLGVDIDDASLDAILPRLSFESMKARIECFQPKSVEWRRKGDNDDFEFIRKGSVGDSKSLFGPAHNAAFDAMVADAWPSGVRPESLRRFVL